MMGSINLTNINLSLSLSPVRRPLTLTEEQKLKNYQDHRSKRIRKRSEERRVGRVLMSV